MKKTLARLAAVLGSLALVMGFGLVAAAPAHAALAPITYIADCPANSLGEQADWQQLVIVDYGANRHAIDVWDDYPNGQIYPLGSWGPNAPVAIHYVAPMGSDTVSYTMALHDNLNWRYHVDCFY